MDMTAKMVRVPVPYLPSDIIVEILIKLPAKSLLRFKSVCKSWNNIISSPQFAKLHYHHRSTRHSPSYDNHHLALIHHFHLRDASLLTSVLSSSTSNHRALCHTFPTESPYVPYDFGGTCHGILLLYTNSPRAHILLWNPCTRHFRPLPLFELETSTGTTEGEEYDDVSDADSDDGGFWYSFGYDNIRDNYKVVVTTEDVEDTRTRVHIHTVGTDSWREIGGFSAVPPECEAKYLNGKLNWLTTGRESASCTRPYSEWDWVIISLDLGREEYQQLMPPPAPEPDTDPFRSFDIGRQGFRPKSLGLLRGCLSMLAWCNKWHTHVWIMKEYGNNDSWSKLVVIPTFMGTHFHYSPDLFHASDEIRRVLIVSDNCDEVTMVLSKFMLTICFTDTDFIYKFDKVDGTMDFKGAINYELYDESLISP